MKATFGLEVDADELGTFAVKVLTKTVFRLIGNQDPNVQSALLGLQQWLMGIAMAGQSRPQPRSGTAYGFSGHGPHGPPGYPYGTPGFPYAPPQGPQGPNNVRPIGGSGAVIEHCFVIDESRYMEAGWCCHQCGTFNGTNRKICRQCEHACCAVAPFPSPHPQPPIPEPAPL